MIEPDKEGLVSPFKNCVAELRANNTSRESQMEAWGLIFGMKMFLGDGATHEDIGTSDTEMEEFWQRDPSIAKAGLIQFIQNCEFPEQGERT